MALNCSCEDWNGTVSINFGTTHCCDQDGNYYTTGADAGYENILCSDCTDCCGKAGFSKSAGGGRQPARPIRFVNKRGDGGRTREILHTPHPRVPETGVGKAKTYSTEEDDPNYSEFTPSLRRMGRTGIRGGLRGSNRGRARRGRAPVNKPYVVQQMVNRGISLALATQFANKISSWWNRGGYRKVQEISRNFSGGGRAMQGASRSLRRKYARGWSTPHTTQYASNSLRGRKLGVGMGRPPVCPSQGGKECWICDLFGGGVGLGNGVTLNISANPSIEWDIGSPLDLSIDLGGGSYSCGISISF